jgi:arylsulfatase A-like enzyme
VDVGPTALALLGIAPAAPKAGVSLAPLMKGAPAARSSVIAELRGALDWRRVDAIVTEDWKFTQHRVTGDSLYDLAADPGELRDVSEERPKIANRLRAELRRQISASLKRGAAVDSDAVAPIDPRLQKQLEALGYADPPESAR